MRAHRGFTLIELMVVVAIAGIVAAIVVWQGRSARQAAGIASGAYELAIRLGGLKARAMADGREYVMVVADTANPLACRHGTECGRVVVLRNPAPGFAVAAFSPEPPIVGAEWVDDGGLASLPANTQFAVTGADRAFPATWRAPPPFDGVAAFDPAVLASCAGGRRCFGIRFRPDGEVRPVLPPNTPVPAGFAFVLRPVELQSAAAEGRAIFVSFPAGVVKTAMVTRTPTDGF